MAGQKSYGQFCPVAKSAELLCKRWTMLVIRELLDGPLGFNDIRSGVLLMSRSLLSARLVELEQSGLLRHISAAPGRRAGYELTEAGYALLPVVEAMGHWGQEWIEPDLTVGDIDFGYLLWSLRRSARRVPEMPESFLVRLHFTDAPDGHDLHWLSYRGPTSTSVTAIRAARSMSGSNAKWSPSPRSGWAGGHFRAACGIKGLSSTGPGSSRRIRSDGWGAAALRPSGNGPVRSGSNPFEARDGSLTKAIFDLSGVAQEGLRGVVEARASEWLGPTGK